MVARGLKTKELAREKLELIADRSRIEHAIFADEYLSFRHAEIELFYQNYSEKDSANRFDRSLPRLLTSSSSDRNDSDGRNPRFWMVMGVALGDPGIRYRLISQLSFGHSVTRATGPATGTSASTSDQRAMPTQSDLPSEINPDDVFGIQRLEGMVPETARIRESNNGKPAEEEEEEEFEGPSAYGQYSGIIVNWRITEDEASTLYWLGFDVIKDRVGSFDDDLIHYTNHLKEDGWLGWPSIYDCEVSDEMVPA
jgi:hypothetical protein